MFGGRTGACAESVVAKADRAIVTKPENVTFEEAAAVGVAATTALQAIRDQGKLSQGSASSFTARPAASVRTRCRSRMHLAAR